MSNIEGNDVRVSAVAKRQRVLACERCQQRKIRCDRTFPCSHCIKSDVPCVPIAAPRPRRRRFPERDLLSRLRKYEDLLTRNGIQFEPLHKHSMQDMKAFHRHSDGDGSVSSPDPESAKSPSYTVKSETADRAKNFYLAMTQKPQDSDDDDESDSAPDVLHQTMNSAWDQLELGGHALLMGARREDVNLASFHPEQVQIFRLWQIYLDNVNPLLKVTHTPTLQVRMIEAVGDLAGVKPVFAALMFSIYCMAVYSLQEDECQTVFGAAKEDLLQRYQYGCQQALLHSNFLRTRDRECLTALHLYLMSLRTSVDPKSLASTLGLAMRIAQQMALNDNSSYSKLSTLEAEMRRRLWWSMVLFDARMAEMSDLRTSNLVPTWNCRPPLNLSDFDIQADDTNAQPIGQGTPTEAIFAVVRGEMSDFIRHTSFHLDFVNPGLKSLAKDSPDSDSMDILERTIEDGYLKFCNPGNPVHFMTMWTARGIFAKNRLLQHYSRFSKLPTQQTEAQRDHALSLALRILDCDTTLAHSALLQGYKWFLGSYFPFPAFIHILKDLKRRPLCRLAERSWEAMNDSQQFRFLAFKDSNISGPFIKLFATIVIPTWEAYEQAYYRKTGSAPEMPKMVADLKEKSNMAGSDLSNTNTSNSDAGALPLSIPTSVDEQNIFSGMEWWDPHEGFWSDVGIVSIDSTQMHWGTSNWDPLQVSR